MSRRDLFLAVRAQAKPAKEIYHHFVNAFGGRAISSSTISRTIRKLSQNSKDDEARDFGG
jgi:hypothetical protein